MARKSFAPNAPTRGVWFLGLILGLAGIIGHFQRIEYLTENKFWLVVTGFALLAIGTTAKKL